MSHEQGDGMVSRGDQAMVAKPTPFDKLTEAIESRLAAAG
jgi:hypothetical protein